MLSLYEMLKASKTGIAPDMWTALAGMNWGGAGSGAETKELTGIPPLTFTANGQPLLDYTIYGNTVQNGTPTPDSPIMPQGTGERTKNLFDKDNAVITHLYPLQDGTTFTQGSEMVWSIILPCKPNTTYTLSKLILSHSSPRHRVSGSEEYPTAGGAQTFIDNNSETISGDTHSRQIFTTTADTHWIVCFLYSNNSYEELIEQLQSLQIEVGNDKTEYEPYGYKLTISSANTTTPVYLGEVQTTRRIKKLVLTGEEEWAKNDTSPNNSLYYLSGLTDKKQADCICTHFRQSSTTYPANNQISAKASAKMIYIYLSKTIIDTMPSGNTKEGFKEYLATQYAAGTPVTVWYVLATPETAVVNEPLRKIGDYVDTLSMEQAGVQIPTNRGNTVIDVLTELKPSEVYIKYKG